MPPMAVRSRSRAEGRPVAKDSRWAKVLGAVLAAAAFSGQVGPLFSTNTLQPPGIRAPSGMVPHVPQKPEMLAPAGTEPRMPQTPENRQLSGTRLFGQQLTPSTIGPFNKLAEAIEHRQLLIREGSYAEEQLGIFAEEFSKSGARHFYVHTYVGFALHYASLAPGTAHYHEVVQDGRPCWLYFDLDLPQSKVRKPHADPDSVLASFKEALGKFCQHELSMELDESAMVILDSSTPKKLSKHVIVRQPGLAFSSNRQLEWLVGRFVAYAKRRRYEDKSCHEMFFDVPADAGGSVASSASIIDTAVYTRNRCFRMLFSSKYGKTATFQLQNGGRIVRQDDDKALQVLWTLASFVPAGTFLFSSAKVPEGFRQRSDDNAKISHEWRHLAEWLMNEWDRVREHEEGFANHDPTKLDQVRERDSILYVSLNNNRYCRQKGRSHKSNRIYFKVDLPCGMYCQRCYDPECDHHQCCWHPLPQSLLSC